MKLVHISDIHINAAKILGSDPVANFECCLHHVKTHHSDADKIVISGDLTHHGHEQSYRKLRHMLQQFGFVGSLTPQLLIGNHDDRETFLKIFSESQRDEDGFVQWAEDTPLGTFIYLDTNEPGTHAGHYCEKRQEWLRDALETARALNQPAWIFMHHNPVPVHVANADIIGIVQQQVLARLFADYKGIVRHIFFGHCHFSLSGSLAGIPISAPRSTSHPNWPEFSGNKNLMGYGPIAPNYNVCFLGNEYTTIHSIDFLEQDNIIWQETKDDGWIEEEERA
ncbi:MAG: metallophosphoesterase [Stappiaceae bacterium]